MSDSMNDPWPWPPELDAMSAAPEYHTLLFENDYVRVLDAHVKPGDTVPVHTHCWPGVLYMETSFSIPAARRHTRPLVRQCGAKP